VQNSDKTLYHYTTHEGLLGITESDMIWGTNVLYLNDASEFNYAKNLLSHKIKSLCDNNPDFKAESSWGYFFFEYLEKNINKLLPSGNYSCFACSFSEASDLLSQWRGYCRNGSGYSLGFSLERLQSCVNPAGFIIKPCIYDENKQTDAIGELVKKASDRFVQEVGRTGENWDAKSRYLSAEIIVEFIQLAPFLKHPKFEEEREWRIVANLETKNVRSLIKFRTGRTMIVPYIEIPLPIVNENLVINEVIVGPTLESEISMASVELLLKSRNIICPNIKCSTIPYRSL
jgi:hypothetical protein